MTPTAPTKSEPKPQPASVDHKLRQASQVRAAAHQQAFATGRGSRPVAPPERERPQKKLTPQERAQAAAAEAQRKLQQAELENSRVRAELRRMQEELESTKTTHTQEVQKAADREAGLWAELNEVRDLASTADRKASGYKKSLFGVLLLLAVPAAVWAAVSYSRPATVHAAVVVPVPVVAQVPVVDGVPVTTSNPSAFTDSVNRLSQALDRFGNEEPQNVLRRVHDANAARGISVCSFEWHNGQVSLVFGNDPGMAIGTTMTRCAEAVERAAK